MELNLLMTAVLGGQPLPDVSTAPDGRALAIGAVCAGLFFALGLAHYAGFAKQLSDVFVFSPYLGLAVGWLGAGVLLIVLAVLVMPANGPSALTIVGVILGLAAAGSWGVGLLGIFWLPPALRPRWMRERLEQNRTPR